MSSDYKTGWPWSDGIPKRADGVGLERGIPLEDGSLTWVISFPSVGDLHQVLLVCETCGKAQKLVDEKWPIAEWYMKLIPWSPENAPPSAAVAFGSPEDADRWTADWPS